MVNKIAEGIIGTFSLLFPYRMYELSIKCKNYIRTIWLRRFFKSIGEHVTIRRIGLLKGMNCICIGSRSSFGNDLYLTAWPDYAMPGCTPEILIGSNCSFGAYNHITSVLRVKIGDNCLTGKWVTITDNSHGETNIESLQTAPTKRMIVSKGPVVIGKNVWIGDKVTILPNCKIGDGAIIAANTVVTHDVPAFCVVGGNPARILKNIKNHE